MCILPLHLAAAACVNELLSRLGLHGVTVVVQPIDEGTDRRIFLILDNCGVVEGAHQRPPGLEIREQALVINVEAKRLGRRVEIGAINKQRNPARG
jgi:hypothetical protein